MICVFQGFLLTICGLVYQFWFLAKQIEFALCFLHFLLTLISRCLTLLAQTSFLHSRNSSSRNRLADRDAPPTNNSGSGLDRDTITRDSFSRWRERQYLGPRRWLETALRDSAFEKETGTFNVVIYTCKTTLLNNPPVKCANLYTGRCFEPN